MLETCGSAGKTERVFLARTRRPDVLAWLAEYGIKLQQTERSTHSQVLTIAQSQL
jgi:hypothetical protein